jgi:heme oxygenase
LLAAESGDRGARYRAFVAALADEERAAAEVARMVDLAAAGQSVSAIDRRNGRMGAQ